MILGTLYLIDEQHVAIIHEKMQQNAIVTENNITHPKVVCMDMTEENDDLERMYPGFVYKATILCPPPSALIAEIDGDQEGFITKYHAYLKEIEDFIATMIYIMHVGGNVLLYTPVSGDSFSIWTSTLLTHFFTEYGIKIGTSETDWFDYDQRYNGVITDMLYKYGCSDIIDFISSRPNQYPDEYLTDPDIIHRYNMEMVHIAGYDPVVSRQLIDIINNKRMQTGQILRPAVLFG